MADVLPAGAAPLPATGASAAAQPSHVGHHGLFHELMSDLNPLQYIPVVGTIYRAITGDQGNSELRFVASLGTSFLLGGPIGLAVTAGEKIAGIDPEKAVLSAARHLFHLGHAEPAGTGGGPAAPAGGATPATATPSTPPSELAFAFNTRAMSADDLNGLELQRLSA